MKHIVQYHKSWELGNPLKSAKPYAFTTHIPSKESLSLNAGAEGARVWLIYRTDPDSTQYYIAYCFKVTDVDIVGDKIELSGSEHNSTVLNPPIELTKAKQKWFSDFLKKHGNFGLGLLPIDEAYSEYFDDYLDSAESFAV
tara:strand:- start:590 stop:1012 length:423 start_codon:yes stop_codon:yes gene_type:complete